MGNSRSRLRVGGDPTEYKHYIESIRGLFNRSDMIEIGINPRSTLRYMAQTFILGEKLLDRDPGSLAQNLTGKVTEEGKPATENQRAAIALAGEWDAAVQTAKENWSSLPTELRQDPNILKYCHDISPDGPDRYLAKLQECFNADAVAVALDSEFGIPGAVPYLTQIWWYQNAEQLPMMPFTTTLLKLRESQPDAVMTANRQSILKLATDWDVSMGAIAAKSGKLMPKMAAAWDAARSANAAVLLDLNRQNRALRVLASTGFGSGVEVVPNLDSSSDRGPFGSVCADMRRVAKSDNFWRSRLLNPEFLFTKGGGDILPVVTSLCAFTDGKTGEPCLLVGSAGEEGVDRITCITGTGTVVGRSPDCDFPMQGIAVLQDGRCIVSNIRGGRPAIRMCPTWNQPLHPAAAAVPRDTAEEPTVGIAILSNPDGSAPICAFKSNYTGIDCYRVSADRLTLNLTPLAYQFLGFNSASLHKAAMCRIPASCPCMCRKAACRQDRLAIVSEGSDYEVKLYILAPGAGLLHEYSMGRQVDTPIAVAVADWRNELVILCESVPDDPAGAFDIKYNLFAWQIENAEPSNRIVPRKLEIDTSFMDDTGACMAAGSGMLFIAGGGQLNGYRY